MALAPISHVKLGVRLGTKRKIAFVARQRHWTQAEAVDQAADALLEREGISMPDPAGNVGDQPAGRVEGAYCPGAERSQLPTLSPDITEL